MKNKNKTKIISRKLEFQGWHKLETVVVEHPSLRHDGYAPAISREVYYCGTVAIGLLYEPETDQILLNRQFRMGAFIAGDEDPWLIECCAGCIDEGESAEDAMRREALEETGCELVDMEFIGKTYPSPGSSEEIFMMYCGRIQNAKAGHHGLHEEGEEIETHLMPVAEAMRLLDSGKITNAAAFMCLNWFGRNHDRLRKKWGGK